MVRNNKIVFDIMIDGMFYATERIPLDKKFVIGDMCKEPIIDEEKLMDLVEKRRPTLKRGKYQIFL